MTHHAAASTVDGFTASHGTPAVNHWVQAGLLALAAAALRTFWLDAPVHMDELYHALAAAGWLESGEPRIADGVYGRSLLYTALVGLVSGVAGDPIHAGRLTSVLFGSALVGLVFLWLRREAGGIAAWSAGLLLALTPVAVEMAQFARFYALHALVFWLATMALWRIVCGEDGRITRVAIGMAGVLFLGVAAHLHTLTVLGAVGAAVWAALTLAPACLRRVRTGGTAIRLAAAGAALAVLLVAALAVAAGLPGELWQKLRYTPAWAAALKNQVHYYHIHLLGQFPLLWPATAILALAAIGFRPKAATFCLAIFGAILAFASLAGLKAPRYLYFGLPFLLALWGIGLQAIWQSLGPVVVEQAGAAAARLPAWLPKRPARTAFLAATALFMLVASGGPAQLLFHLAKDKAPVDAGRLTAEWASLGDAIGGRLADAELVLASNELAALHWLGRADLVVHASRLSELDLDADRGIDPRTGLPVIRTEEDVAAAMACRRSGLVILDDRDHGAAGVPDGVRAVIAERATRLPAPGVHTLEVYHWQHAGPLPACPGGDGA